MADQTRIDKPIDTTGVQLPAEIAALTERLAAQVHSVWAQQRIGEGWTWGPKRDDAKKQHPDLVPYEQLPDSEKQYDRATMQQTLKAIMALGYRLSPTHGEAVLSVDDERSIAELTGRLNDDDVQLVELFKTLWQDDNESFWRGGRDFHVQFTKALISNSHATAAFDYASKALGYLPDDAALKYLRSLALARGRNVKMARNLTEDLLADLNKRDSPDKAVLGDALSLAGRLFKDLARTTRSNAKRKRYFTSSQERYERAYRLTDDWFPGINAATMALLAGAEDRAARHARKVIEQASAGLDADGSSTDYWLLATLGEANLILQDFDKATDLYRRAVALANGRIGDIASMRRNVELLDERIDVPLELLELFTFGPVAVFSGHMIDAPDRKPPRFPAIPELEKAVAAAIAARLDEMDPVIGYCSLACGSDILFAEQMLERGRELHVVLPFDLDDFHRTSVDFGIPEMYPWRSRCEQILQHAQVHYATRERYLGDASLFDFTNRIMQGLAIVRAEDIGVEAVALVVHEPRSTLKAGGANAFLDQWRRIGGASQTIDIRALRHTLAKSARPIQRSKPEPTGEPKRKAGRRVQYMLFSDVKNFSQLKEEHSPEFFDRFIRLVVDVLETGPGQPAFTNTWGDALYVVFDRPADCAEFGLKLLERMDRIDWTKHNLPADTAMRVGMHAGPVYRRMNQIIGREDVFGSHVNLAARIEPVTTPGSVFVSEHFAAELTLEAGEKYLCEYVGVQELAKRFGKAPLYRLARR